MLKFLKIIAPKKPHFVQSVQRIYIMPTLYGVFYAALVLSTLLASAAMASAYGNLLAVIMVSIGIMAMFMTHQNMENLVLSFPSEFLCCVAKDSVLEFMVEDSSRSPHFGLEFHLESKSVAHKAGNLAYLEEKQLVNLTVSPSRVGVIDISRIKVGTRYPLGLFYSWKWIPVEAQMFVFPEPIGISALNATGTSASGIKIHSHDPQELAEFRNFHKGDSLRRVYWRALARGRPLVVRSFEMATDSHRHFRWVDAPQKTPLEKAEQLSFWIHEAYTQGHEFSLESPIRLTKKAKGYDHYSACLKDLCKIEYQ